MRSVILERLELFISDPASGDFDELARESFQFQFERSAPLRKLCRRQAVKPTPELEWRQIPPVPVLAYKTLDLAVQRGGVTFRSSGTTSGHRSRHRHPFLQLYRATIDAAFPQFCLGDLEQPPILSLVPGRDQAPDSSLSFMLDHVLRKWGASDSVTAVSSRGVEVARARSFFAARQRDRRPLLVLATTFALVHLLEALDRLDLRFRLPAGSLVFETGGYKGRSRELNRRTLLVQLQERLDIPGESVVSEYGMTELTSQFYSRVLAGGEPDRFVAPHWTRVRVLDPVTLREVSPGTTGLLCIFDLANLSSAVHLLTEDLGVAEAEGFRLRGRAVGAELRGCSLAAEELMSSESSES